MGSGTMSWRATAKHAANLGRTRCSPVCRVCLAPASGECLVTGGGSLTLQADDTLLREHQMPDFTASGPLTRRK
jgi:hypothetical protein